MYSSFAYYSLLFPLSRCSRSRLVDRSGFGCPTAHTLLSFLRIFLFENLATSRSTFYCLLFLRHVANICLPLVPDAINASPSISTRVHDVVTFEGCET